MDDIFVVPKPDTIRKSTATLTSKSIKGVPSETKGKISETIGTGENAKNSIVWVTIRWSFILGGAASVGLYFRPMYCHIDNPSSLIEDIKATWSIFIPIITLALGYTFGKGK